MRPFGCGIESLLRDGIVVPSEGDVGWYAGNEWHAVWKGRITRFELR